MSLQHNIDKVQHGLYLVPPHGEMVWNGNKVAIVESRNYALSKKSVFVCAGNYCYGIAKFDKSKEISLEEFDQLRDKHRITNAERDVLWPKASTLFYFEILDFSRFDVPRQVYPPESVRSFTKNAERFFLATQIDPELEPAACLNLPTPEESERELLGMDGKKLAAVSFLNNENTQNDTPLKYHGEMSNTDLLLEHAKIHESAKNYKDDGNVSIRAIARHSVLIGEMKSRGMDHYAGTVLDHNSPGLGEQPSLKIQALGTRANTKEWNKNHEKFTGVLVTAHGKKILLDCGDKSFIEKNPALVVLSNFRNDHFAWHSFKPIEQEINCDEFSMDLQRSPVRTYGGTIYRHIRQFNFPEHDVYLEPFCGSASVLFSKKPSKTEVINDLNDDTIFALRFIKSLSNGDMTKLKRKNWTPSLETWKRNRDEWKRGRPKDKAHRFYLQKYLSLYSFHWSGSDPAGTRVEGGSTYNPDVLFKAKDRLKHVKIYKGDYRQIMRMYDSPKTFMFLDPPYRKHVKGAYKDEGLDWDSYYGLIKSLKCQYIILNSNSSEDKAWFRKLGIKFHVATFPGSSSYRIGGSKNSPGKKKKFICGASFPLVKHSGKKGKAPIAASDDFKVITFDDKEFESDIPSELFIAHPYSKCEDSQKAEDASFNIEWVEEYCLDAFNLKGFPVQGFDNCPSVAWKIKTAGQIILFMPNALQFDPKIFEDVNIYIGDGSSHMGIRNQIEKCKEAGIEDIYFVHVGEEVIEGDLAKEIKSLGARILKDNEIVKKLIQLSDNEIIEKSLPRKEIAYGRSIEDFDKHTLVKFASETATILSLEIEDFVEAPKEPPVPEVAELLIKKWSGISREKLAEIDPKKLPENFYVIQAHHRGKTSHFDLRIKENGLLDGETILNQTTGTIEEPVTTIDQAAMLSKRYHSDQAAKYTKCYPEMPPHKGFMVLDKSSQPLAAITMVNSVIEPGQIGATKEFPGVFYGEDWGIAYRTVRKPWFVETWLFGKWFKGARLIERLIPVTEKTKRVGKKKVYWRGHISDPKSPPYIFSPSFFKNTEWIPEDSALPPHWEAIVPKKLVWWGKGLPGKQRLDLIKATFNWLVEEDFLKGKKKVLDKDDFTIILSPEKWPYVLQRIWWRGPVHVRYLPVSTWRLRLKHKDGSLLTFEFEADPTRISTKGFTALRSISSTKPPSGENPSDWLKHFGDLPAKHPENPSNDLIARVVIEDSGNFSPVSDTGMFLSGNFSGKKLGFKGYYTMKQRSSESDFWLFEKSLEGEKRGN